VNNQKRDKLPSTHLVEHRKDAILYYWGVMKSGMTGRFTSDYLRITGQERLSDSDWHRRLFSVFLEVLETTAATRGAPRWHGI